MSEWKTAEARALRVRDDMIEECCKVVCMQCGKREHTTFALYSLCLLIRRHFERVPAVLEVFLTDRRAVVEKMLSAFAELISKEMCTPCRYGMEVGRLREMLGAAINEILETKTGDEHGLGRSS